MTKRAPTLRNLPHGVKRNFLKMAHNSVLHHATVP
eukprot:CAMPEP_0173380456 /NCGR_PEP_ID=MMETSP1356-20130122/3139_1 /TAXON_ID=77927 ORGANISM="Hemiselmis virescens, Strain PCC157" /NCGR_SAMPLE_ID=MMETSP1356 /ASSEMBLY_ACC=CAM_ASM_000847 /LENGTH=34 /DNA_ID= /DNA_START= /DNA_END= /DNA_ORIENTATION=